MKLFFNRFSLIVLFLFCYSATNAQLITVKGRVVAEEGGPLPGVSVLLHQQGAAPKPMAATDQNGHFTVSVPGNARLELRFISFETLVVPVNNRTSLSIVMKPSSTSLKESVIVGYQKKTRETVTGAVTRITGKELQDVPVSNVEQLLQGRVAGLNIQQNTGAPGFRGASSIRGLSQMMVNGSGDNAYLTPQSPLYVIDGVPVDANAGFEYGFQSQGPGTSPLSLIPPEDIQSIDVMKDAEATALYGSRGANGVIVITTRRGQSAVPIVRYAGNMFINFTPQLRSTIGGKDERAYRVKMIRDGNNLSEIYRISQTQFLSDSLNAFFNNSTNWQDIYYQTTYNHTHNVSVSGGDQRLNYKTNLNYYTEEGVVRNTGFDRYSLNQNVNFNPTPRLQLSGYLSAGLGKKLKGSGNGLTDVGAGSNVSSSLLPGPSYFNNVGHFTNSIYRVNDTRTYDIRTYLNIMYELVPHLQLSTNTSYNYTSDQEDTFIPALANNDKPAVYGFSGRKSNLYNRSSINYNNTWKEKHSVYASVFSEATIVNVQNKVINQSNGPNDNYHGPYGFSSYFSSVSGTPDAGGFSEVHSVGFAANLSYDYNKKYVVNFNYRADGNSFAGENERWAHSPSVGLRWNFNKEKLFEHAEWLDFGDLRFSYGVNLRPTTNIYASMGWYDVKGNYNGVTRISPHLGQMPNPFLLPEEVEQFNYGFDMSIFKGRIGLTLDAYTKTVYNMLYSRKLSTGTGFEQTFTNDASIYNYGYEAMLTVRPFKSTSKINWTISLNGAVNRDVVLSLPGGAAQLLSDDKTIINRVGYSATSNYLHIYEGVYRTNADVPVDPITGLPMRNEGKDFYKGGDSKFRDVDGNYVLNDADLQVAGTPIARITGGFSSYLTYKNWSINLNGTILFKRDLLNKALAERMTKLRDPFDDATFVDLRDLDYWKGNGDVAKYPNPFDYYSTSDSYRIYQTLFQEDGSFIKLNAVTVGYSVDRTWLRRFGMNAFRMYTTVSNPLLFTGYSGPNPEAVTDLGRDRLDTYPVARSLSFGLNIEF
ncbi:SusC/RagA family TonB-linked outer membrane protein [Chitinophaga rhizosphaerae]|uniref:SusC/RagA family TonB-linked outer membrane protein n=1 Tax=Chitinophaga rhizosphaerae TaxID=1864947 RepID=UPI000F80D24C|nr:SusC/RagA family TonB-linked outer membrane protein [Chitinophaga rhizosphaerae]